MSANAWIRTQPIALMDKNGHVGPAQPARFQWKEAVDNHSTTITADGNTAHLTLAGLDPNLPFRRLYFGAIFDDIFSLACVGRLVFKLQDQIVGEFPVRKGLPAANHDTVTEFFQFPSAFARVNAEAISGSDQINVPMVADAMLVDAYYGDGTYSYFQRLMVPPFHVTVACDTVQLIFSNFTVTGGGANPKITFALGLYSQTWPL